MLPQSLIEEFWQKVNMKLVKDHGKKPSESESAVKAYRQLMENKAGDMVYHQNIGEVVETIRLAMEHGLLQGKASLSA